MLQIVSDFLDRIETINPEQYPPEAEPCDHVKRLVVIEDLWIRRVWSLCQSYRREQKETELALEYERDAAKKRQLDDSKSRAAYLATLYGKLFWFVVREQYSIWEPAHIGLYQGWEIYDDSAHHNDDGPPPIIRKLFGLE